MMSAVSTRSSPVVKVISFWSKLSSMRTVMWRNTTAGWLRKVGGLFLSYVTLPAGRMSWPRR